ncbi:MAG: hypothetical protein DRH24_18300, partial [Deltaproteobacteria bacterium]
MSGSETIWWDSINTGADGTFHLFVYCNDSLGNEGSNNTIYFTVDTTPPIITWEPPTPGDDTTTNNNWVYLNTTITDDSNTSAFFDWNHSLVGYWSFEYYNSTGVYDNSTYNNFGTFQETNFGADNITTGKYGKGLKFDGTDDYIEVPDSSILHITDKITLEAWVYPFGWDTSYENAIVTKAGDGSYGVWNLHWKNTTHGFRFELNNGSVQSLYESSPSTTLNTWYHVVGVYDGNKMYLYVNGKLSNSMSVSGQIATNTEPLRIGKQFWWSTTYSFWNGTIDEVRIYNRALSPEEINASYNNGLYRLYHNFTSLSDGTYNYTAWAIDLEGNMNKTSRGVTVDTTPPKYFDNSTNSTIAGTPVKFSLRWTDETGLSGYIFQFCNGTWNGIDCLGDSGEDETNFIKQYNGAYLTDDFNDNSLDGGKWGTYYESDAACWVAEQNNRLEFYCSDNQANIQWATKNITNGTVEVEVYPNGTDVGGDQVYPGIIARAQGSSSNCGQDYLSCARGSETSNNHRITPRASDCWNRGTALVSGTFAHSYFFWYNLTFTLDGSNLTSWIRNTTTSNKISVNDNTYSSGYLGLFNGQGSTYFDNFRFYPLSISNNVKFNVTKNGAAQSGLNVTAYNISDNSIIDSQITGADGIASLNFSAFNSFPASANITVFEGNTAIHSEIISMQGLDGIYPNDT